MTPEKLDEIYVRLHWKDVWENERTGEPRISDHTGRPKMFHNWEEAAAFTEDHLESIRQIKEERFQIVAVRSEWANTSDPFSVQLWHRWSRVLDRTDKDLADLKRGMR